MLLIRGVSLPYTAGRSALTEKAARALGIEPRRFQRLDILSCSLDARKKNDIRYLYHVLVTLDAALEQQVLKKHPADVSLYIPPEPIHPVPGTEAQRGRVLVVGLGPAGLFAAYTLARMGYRPLVIDRGKPVEERVADVNALWSSAVLNPESNPMFGEGGAGTFSDGKLTSRSKDPRGAEVLKIFTGCGAPEEIRYLAKPHIGTDKLRAIVVSMRNRIIGMGGEVRFSTKLTGLCTSDGKLTGAVLQRGGVTERVEVSACVLAIGLAARDTWRMLLESGIALAPKPFAVGVRVEHPQQLINESRLGPGADISLLGAAEYRITAECSGRGVYSFCMCPGGYVVNTSSAPGQLSVNGMSYSARDGENANAALIVQVPTSDFGDDALKGIQYCESLEEKAFLAGGSGYRAPASRLEDFLNRQRSGAFGSVLPSVRPEPARANLWECLPENIAGYLAESFASFSKQIKGFDLPDAVLTAVETRSSAPVRILRDAGGESVSLSGLYPVGEGAGYAGGIVSAAIDGMRAAERIITRFRP